jgi:hypothetical protein
VGETENEMEKQRFYESGTSLKIELLGRMIIKKIV